MNKTHDTTRKKERALLVGVAHDRQENRLVDDYLEELALLADTDGVEVVASVKQQLRQIDPSTYIGKGKVHEIVLKVQAENIQVVIFDDDLSPGQTKNIEREAKCKIIDRSALILDIFAKRARTRESKTQVELAQLEYLLPRLSKMWTHLERQGGGGVFTKGPGETQLETDRRLVGQRIAVLKEELKKIERQRETQRAGRGEIFRVALVGYTNVGKSTLLNALSQADVYVEDRLFATLDATTRKVFLDNDHSCLITDTVGFIRKLPHHLVASFRSTLEEVREADILLHVVDLSSPIFMEQMEAVEKVLRELNALKDARI
ncbi:MAG TPA: GTPase HflX, partial [bacterium]|nr:GTPase HflX [bacterium]